MRARAHRPMLGPEGACRAGVRAEPVLRDRLRERVVQERWVPTLVTRQSPPRHGSSGSSSAHVRSQDRCSPLDYQPIGLLPIALLLCCLPPHRLPASPFSSFTTFASSHPPHLSPPPVPILHSFLLFHIQSYPPPWRSTYDRQEAALEVEAQAEQRRCASASKLRDFRTAVKQRVRAQAAVKRQTLRDLSLEAVQREHKVISQSAFDDKVKRNPQVVRGGGSVYQSILADKGITAHARHAALDTLTEAVARSGLRAREDLCTHKVGDADATCMPGGAWNRNEAVGQTLGSLEQRAARRGQREQEDALDDLVSSSAVRLRHRADKPTLHPPPSTSRDLPEAVRVLNAPQIFASTFRSAGVAKEEERRQKQTQFSMCV